MRDGEAGGEACDMGGEHARQGTAGDGAIPGGDPAGGATEGTPAIRLRAGGSSSTGCRPKNDDCYAIGRGSYVYAVSDGIGGAPDGDVMSRVGCGASLGEYERGDRGADPDAALGAAFRAGNEASVQVASWIDNPYCGATLLLAALDGATMRFRWVGDTVAYRLRDGELELLTEKGRRPGGGNALDAAIGYECTTEPRAARCDVRPGDRFLLCTDGVWETYEGVLGMGLLAGRLGDAGDAPLAADVIAGEAGRDGSDNATAVVLFAEAEEKDGVPASAPLDGARAGGEARGMDDVRARQGTAGDGAAPGGSPADDATEEMPAIGPEAGRPFPLGCRPEDDGCPDGNLPGYAGSEDFRRFEEANPWLGGSDARSQCGTMRWIQLHRPSDDAAYDCGVGTVGQGAAPMRRAPGR